MKLPGINLILKYQLIFLVGILISTGGIFIYTIYNLLTYQPPAPIIITQEKNEPVKNDLTARRIDGVEVEKGKENLYPAAITIDNHFDAWPNYGLSQASVVYETKVEGSATRFLAIYTPDKDEVIKIGPVRSTRPYFVELAKEYGALLAHSGGSPAGLARIEELGVSNLEEIAWWGPDYFWRVYSREAPHNLFTSSNNLAQGVTDWELGDKIPNYRAWKFQPADSGSSSVADDQPMADNGRGEEAKAVHIEFSEAPVYDAAYQYSSSTEKYLRWQGGEKHIDALNNQQIAVSNVIIQFVPQEIVLDTKGRIELNLIGRNKAWIFRDGRIAKGSWEKRDYDSRTIFYNEDGNEIEFKPGNIWIEIVPRNRRVKVK